MIFAMIVSGLALLAATTGLVIAIGNKKRSEERSAVLFVHIDETAKQCNAHSDESIRRLKIDLLKKDAETDQRIKNLENGITPDYEQAREAAKAVNNFSQGLTNILGFDPVNALQAERRKKEQGDGT